MRAILERELLGLFRTRRAFAIQAVVAVVCVLLIALRWPAGGQADLAGQRSREMFVLFGYCLLASIVLLVPSFPASSIVRERQQNTLVLLLNSPLRATTIYAGKLVATLGFVVVLIILSFPAAAACYAMGGISFSAQVAPLYAVLLLLAVQLGAVGLWVSSRSRTPDAALRMIYACVLGFVVLTVVPWMFLQGGTGLMATTAAILRCVSPIPAIMELLGQSGVGQRDMSSLADAPKLYAQFALLSIAVFSAATIRRLNFRILDRPRSPGVLTEDRSATEQGFRRLFFLVDPHRRKSEIRPLTNPVMVKEFRSRQFGRLHWLLRLIAGCMIVSLTLTFATTLGSADWGVETIGGIIVVMQIALIVLITPGLAGGLISGEHESGGWRLLQMTPMSAGVILRGKLLSVAWTMLLILCATLPGFLVMIWINPLVKEKVRQVVICLVLTSVFSILLTMTVSSFLRRSAQATATAYVLLLLLCGGPLLFWLGRNSPFGHSTVNSALRLNPLAAALSVIETPGFTGYELVPANWWILGGASAGLLLILILRVHLLLRPD